MAWALLRGVKGDVMEESKELEGIKLNLKKWLASQKEYVKREQKKTYPLDSISNKTPLETDQRMEREEVRAFIEGADSKELCALSLALALRVLDFAELALAKGGLARAINLLMASDSVMKTFFKLQNKSLSLEAARSELAKQGGLARLANDPKQAEKTFVFECWQSWQKKPDSYKSKAAFSRDMITKCEHLVSQKIIEDWCRAWGKANPAG
jgi:hypothetical protein